MFNANDGILARDGVIFAILALCLFASSPVFASFSWFFECRIVHP